MIKWILAKFYLWSIIRGIDKIIDMEYIGKPSKKIRKQLRAIHFRNMYEELEEKPFI